MPRIIVDEGILLYAIRYSIGRYTYAPTETIEAAKSSWDSLSYGTKVVLQREVKDYIKSQEGKEQPFAGMDLKAWVGFYDWTNQQQEKTSVI